MPDLLALARDRLKALNVPAHIEALPTVPAECAALRGRKILLVDDGPEVFALFVPLLVAATEGTAEFLLHRGEPADGLVQSILRMEPEILLLDEYLAASVRGHLVARALSREQPALRVLGFSNAESARVLFGQSGAAGFVFKDLSDPEATLRALAAIVE